MENISKFVQKTLVNKSWSQSRRTFYQLKQNFEKANIKKRSGNYGLQKVTYIENHFAEIFLSNWIKTDTQHF